MRNRVLILIAVTWFACLAREARATDPCSLVPRADVQTLFGELKGAPKPSTGLRGEHECRYQNVRGNWLKLSLYGADRWSLERSLVSEQHPTPLPHLGDDAFRVKQGTDTVIYIRKGNGMLEVSCSCGFETTRAIAGKAIAKL